MSWAAHQFETYAIHAHLPERLKLRTAYLAIVAGDQTPDFIAKFWVYGVEINGRRYGAEIPWEFHRGWPGAGFSHSMILGALVGFLIFKFTKSKPWTLGYLLGFAAHCITDINDSVGTMLLWPFWNENLSLGTWAYAATVEGGKYLDAAAYYSSPGFLMDVFWLAVVLLSWRVLTKAYWRKYIVPSDPKVWAWLGRRMPEVALVALYRALFFYGVTRLIAWTTWAHLIEDFPWDLTWRGPYWIQDVSISDLPVFQVITISLILLVAVVAFVSWLNDRWIRQEQEEALSRG